MKLWIFINGINVTDPTICIHNSLCGSKSIYPHMRAKFGRGPT